MTENKPFGVPAQQAFKLGWSLMALAMDQCEWSGRTFGGPDVKGPIGALRHLEKEAAEAASNPGDETEYADCLILLIDATWRKGMTLPRLIEVAREKMRINRQRKWPAPNGDDPVEHVK